MIGVPASPKKRKHIKGVSPCGVCAVTTHLVHISYLLPTLGRVGQSSRHTLGEVVAGECRGLPRRGISLGCPDLSVSHIRDVESVHAITSLILGVVLVCLILGVVLGVVLV